MPSLITPPNLFGSAVDDVGEICFVFISLSVLATSSLLTTPPCHLWLASNRALVGLWGSLDPFGWPDSCDWLVAVNAEAVQEFLANSTRL